MVIVEGHTDSQLIPSSLINYFPTNWELSAARASNVVNYLNRARGKFWQITGLRAMQIDGQQRYRGMM